MIKCLKSLGLGMLVFGIPSIIIIYCLTLSRYTPIVLFVLTILGGSYVIGTAWMKDKELRNGHDG